MNNLVSLSNSYTTRDSAYAVDLEQYSWAPSWQYGWSENLELLAGFAVDWQGGGIMDSAIDHWHNFFGMPQGGRNEATNNQFQVAANTTDSQQIYCDQEGYRLGNVNLGAKYLIPTSFSAENSLTLHSSLLLPISTGYYQQDSFDLSLGLLYGHRGQSYNFTTGLYYSYLDDNFEQDIVFYHHQVSSFVNINFPITESVRVTSSLWGATSAVKNISLFPDYQTYLDVGLAFPLGQSSLIAGVRENPMPSEGTTDITFFIQLTNYL